MKPYDIITIGSATRDIFARTSAFDIHKSKHAVSGFEGCLPMGAKIDINELSFDTGGGATNTAAAFANFGLKTAVVCRVGHDFGGQEIIRVLKHYGVDTRFIIFDTKVRTAYSIVLLTEVGERTILVYRGASKNFSADSIPWNKLYSQWLYVSSLGGNLNLLKQILSIAQKRGIKVGWNPGGIEIKMGFKKLEPFIKLIDVLIMNEEEMIVLLTSKNPPQSPFYKGGGGQNPPQSPLYKGGGTGGFIKVLRFLPRRALVITQGGKGAIAVDKQETLSAPSSGTKAVNTTGAGDAFSSGFIAGLWKWDNLSLALRLGILNSGMVVAKMGAKAGLLTKLPSQERLEQISVRLLKL